MENFFEAAFVAASLAVGVPLLLILANLAVEALYAAWLIGNKVERLVREKIDKQIKRLRRKPDDD